MSERKSDADIEEGLGMAVVVLCTVLCGQVCSQYSTTSLLVVTSQQLATYRLCSPLSQVEAMLAKYEWITGDRQYFGQPNTAYDFQANDPKEVGRRLTKLQEQKVGRGMASEKIFLSYVMFVRRDLYSHLTTCTCM